MRIVFRTKILILMITAILIPSVLLSVFIMSQSRVFYDGNINPELEQGFENDLERIESFFSDSKAEMELYASMIEINQEDAYIFSILDNFLVNNPTFINSYFTKEVGGDYLDHHRSPGVDGRERLWYKAAKENGFSISEPYVDILTNEWVVTLSIPAFKNDAFYGVLGVDFLITDIVNSMSSETNISQSSIILKNDRDEIIYYDQSIHTHQEAEALLNDTPEGCFIKHYELDKLHQDLYIVYSANAYNAEIKKISYDMAIILVFIGVITIIMAFSSASKITIPLNEFKDAIHHVSETHEVYSSGHDIDSWNEEFVTLFTKFNMLVKKFEEDKLMLQNKYNLLSEKNQALLEKNMELEDLFKSQKLLDRRIRKSQQDYHSILNNINGMVWVLDNEGQIIFINNKLKKHLGYDDSQLIDSHISDLIYNHYSDKLDFFSMVKTRDYTKIELNIIDAKGDVVLVESSTSRVFDKNKLLYIYGICRDIRETKALHRNFSVKLQEQNLIMDLTETASMNMSLHQVMQSIFNKLNIIFGWSAATIRFLNEDNNFELISKTLVGEEYVTDMAISYENSCLGYAVDKDEIIYILDVENLPVKEPVYTKMLNHGYALVFIPVGTNDIGRGVITVTVEKDALTEKYDTLRAFTNTIIIVVERALIYEKLKKDYIRMIKVLAEAGDDKDSTSVGHSNRVAYIARKIGEQLYLDDEEIIDLEVCGLLHDIGKIGISDEFLSYEAQQTKIGQEKVKEHPVIGRHMLQDIGLSENILDGIEYHHVNYDLSGYPDVNYMEVLPLFSRIIRVADQFDVLRNTGVFENSRDIWFEMAMSSGTLYCPQIMKVLKEVIDKKLI